MMKQPHGSVRTPGPREPQLRTKTRGDTSMQAISMAAVTTNPPLPHPPLNLPPPTPHTQTWHHSIIHRPGHLDYNTLLCSKMRPLSVQDHTAGQASVHHVTMPALV